MAGARPAAAGARRDWKNRSLTQPATLPPKIILPVIEIDALPCTQESTALRIFSSSEHIAWRK